MIVVVGLSHRTAPIAVREKIALPKDDIPRVLGQITSRPAVGEAMLVSTCNRVELVVAGRQGVHSDLDVVAKTRWTPSPRVAPGLRAHLYVHPAAPPCTTCFAWRRRSIPWCWGSRRSWAR